MADRRIGELEESAICDLTGALDEPMRVAAQVLNGITGVWAIETPGTMTKAQIVRMLLLQRLQNDLRCCCLDAVRGYPLQAATLLFSGHSRIIDGANSEGLILIYLSHLIPIRVAKPERSIQVTGLP